MSDTLGAIGSTTRRSRGTPALFVGLAGDAPRAHPARVGLGAIERLDLGRSDRRKVERRKADGVEVAALALADPRMSSQHARLVRAGGAWIVEDLSSKNGTWIGATRVARQPLADGDVIVLGQTALVYREAGGDGPDLDGEPAAILPGLLTLSPVLAARHRELAAAATRSVPIEITGDSGTGKELIARAVHALSGRRGSFVAVHCAEAQLGDGEPGFIAEAAGGTLFLDDVAELPTESQPALVRALERAGDLRLVTATHRELDGEVAANRFRADLRARLLGVAVALPPLRHRREDLGMLVHALLDRLAPGRAVTFSADAVSALYAHDWPLNVRELERSLAAALAVAGERIELQHLPAAVGSTEPMDQPAFRTMSAPERELREQLVAAIARHQGNLAGVAREMGKDRTQIRRWMKRFGITRDVSES